jgi:hypothetical protein
MKIMEKYFEIREQLKSIQNELGLKLEAILEKYGYDRSLAWFNFNQDRFIIIWTVDHLPMEILRAFEQEFGEIKEIHTTTMSNNFNIWFKKEGE